MSWLNSFKCGNKVCCCSLCFFVVADVKVQLLPNVCFVRYGLESMSFRCRFDAIRPMRICVVPDAIEFERGAQMV